MLEATAPSPDALQKLLGPLQSLDPSRLRNGLDPSLPSLDDTLQFESDGLPTWWPESRPSDDGPAWSPGERRNVLLRNLREHLPSAFPETPKTPDEKQQLANTLRHIHGALIYGASGILASS